MLERPGVLWAAHVENDMSQEREQTIDSRLTHTSDPSVPGNKQISPDLAVKPVDSTQAAIRGGWPASQSFSPPGAKGVRGMAPAARFVKLCGMMGSAPPRPSSCPKGPCKGRGENYKWHSAPQVGYG